MQFRRDVALALVKLIGFGKLRKALVWCRLGVAMSTLIARSPSRIIRVVLALLVATSCVSVASSPALAATTGSVRYSNQAAYAYQDFTLECRYGFTSMSAGTVNGERRLDYFEYVYNYCNGLLETYRSGYATPASYSFKLPLKFGTPAVHVSGSVPLTDLNTGVGAGSIYLDATWTPTGTITRTNSMTTQTLPDGSLLRTLTRGMSSQAGFTGPFPATGASIVSEKGSTLEITLGRM